MTSGITKRWLLNILSVVALIIVVIVLNSLFPLDVTN